MKGPQEFLLDVARRFENTWHVALGGGGGGGDDSWPQRFPLGQPTRKELEGDYGTFHRRVLEWKEWADTNGVELTWTHRLVHGTTQKLPTHATVTSVDEAARLVGPQSSTRIARGRERLRALSDRFPSLESVPTLVRAVDSYTDTDFELLCRAGEWFAQHDASGLTPRQVPLEGFHTKWLKGRQALVRTLSGKDHLQLLPPHPSRLYLTYLDPQYLALGGRRYDAATVGDRFLPAYSPSVVVISENKDTAMHFPPLPAAISIEGFGSGGSTAAAFPWVTTAPALFYWGDIDADGFEIIDGFRRDGVPVTSILMDLHTYTEYMRFGADTDPSGNPLTAKARRLLPHLTDAEREVYELVTDPEWGGVRRLEQERIPLQVAVQAIRDLL